MIVCHNLSGWENKLQRHLKQLLLSLVMGMVRMVTVRLVMIHGCHHVVIHPVVVDAVRAGMSILELMVFEVVLELFDLNSGTVVLFDMGKHRFADLQSDGRMLGASVFRLVRVNVSHGRFRWGCDRGLNAAGCRRHGRRLDDLITEVSTCKIMITVCKLDGVLVVPKYCSDISLLVLELAFQSNSDLRKSLACGFDLQRWRVGLTVWFVGSLQCDVPKVNLELFEPTVNGGIHLGIMTLEALLDLCTKVSGRTADLLLLRVCKSMVLHLVLVNRRLREPEPIPTILHILRRALLEIPRAVLKNHDDLVFEGHLAALEKKHHCKGCYQEQAPEDHTLHGELGHGKRLFLFDIFLRKLINQLVIEHWSAHG